MMWSHRTSILNFIWDRILLIAIMFMAIIQMMQAEDSMLPIISNMFHFLIQGVVILERLTLMVMAFWISMLTIHIADMVIRPKLEII